MDWSGVDLTRQSSGVLALPLEVAASLNNGSAEVHKYWEPTLERFVVGKHVVVRGGTLLADALREPQLQAKLVHDHLVPVITVSDVLDTSVTPPVRLDNVVEIITPFYSDGSVFDALSTGRRFDVVECLDIARAAALGLCELHREGFVHRDMKSLNVFLTGDARVARVGDLGEAHPLVSGRAPGFDSPTPWIAPEQVAANTCTVLSDLFGVGVMLVETLLGGLDLRGYSRDAAHARMSRGDTPMPQRLMAPPPWAPPAIRTLIRQLTERRPDLRRPTTAAELADRLSNTRAIGWAPVSPERWEGIARTDGRRYAVAVTYRPRRAEWDARIEREGSSGWRALESSTHADVAHPVLQKLFDRALTLAS